MAEYWQLLGRRVAIWWHQGVWLRQGEWEGCRRERVYDIEDWYLYHCRPVLMGLETGFK